MIDMINNPGSKEKHTPKPATLELTLVLTKKQCQSFSIDPSETNTTELLEFSLNFFGKKLLPDQQLLGV